MVSRLMLNLRLNANAEMLTEETELSETRVDFDSVVVAQVEAPYLEDPGHREHVVRERAVRFGDMGTPSSSAEPVRFARH